MSIEIDGKDSLACCGIDCLECPAYRDNCPGCNVLAGKPDWLAEIGLEQCVFYACCVGERAYRHCGYCMDMPCNLFFDFIDPSMSIAERQKWFSHRLENLKLG
jgi:hypothetical protein